MINRFLHSRNMCGGFVIIVLVFTVLPLHSTYINYPQIDFLIENPDGEIAQGSFLSIQEAINTAESGSIVFVPSGEYFEHIVVNKTISLVGDNASTTVIDGSNLGTVVTVTADSVSITGFTIRNSGWGWTRNGIYAHKTANCTIKNNFLINNCHNIRLNHSQSSNVMDNVIDGIGYGIRLINSINCTAIGNIVSNCIGGVHLQNATKCIVKRNLFTQNNQGIRLYSPCTYNSIVANTVYNNTYEGMIEKMPDNVTLHSNYFFHNNFLNNTYPFIYKAPGNIWDSGYPTGGNYWSRYNGTDFYSGPFQNETGSDGMGDSSYAVDALDKDKYPLMYPWSFLPIHNIQTGEAYNAIQDAIDASQTLDGHTLWVDSGIYRENVNVHKSLSLIGEDELTTVIDGKSKGTVLFVDTDNVHISRFTVCNSGSDFPPYGNDCGVLLNHSSGSRVSDCLIMDNRIGIYLFFSRSNIVDHNQVSSNNENGIWLWYSGNNLLEENSISDNPYNFGVFGSEFSDFDNAITLSNTVDGKLVKYLINVNNATFSDQADIGVVYLINCTNVVVRNLNLTRNGHGVFYYKVSNSTIERVSASGNNYGIYIQDSSGIVAEENLCWQNWVGICLQDSDYNKIVNNIAGDSEKGISLYNANDNLVRANTILNNIYGIRLYYSHLNQIFHNNFIENIESASPYFSYQNLWDNGCEGNYWSDHYGEDLDSDGVIDSAYAIDGDTKDNYPLVNPYWTAADINHDLKVDMRDIGLAGRAFNSSSEQQNWNPHCDITGSNVFEPDGEVDLKDIVLISIDFGRVRIDCRRIALCSNFE